MRTGGGGSKENHSGEESVSHLLVTALAVARRHRFSGFDALMRSAVWADIRGVVMVPITSPHSIGNHAYLAVAMP